MISVPGAPGKRMSLKIKWNSSTLKETAGAREGGGNPLAVAIGQLSLLKDDPQLIRFITTQVF